jgi:hypothetical protein
MVIHFRSSGTLFCSFYDRRTNENAALLIHPKITSRSEYRCMVRPLLPFSFFWGGTLTSLPDNLSSLTALLSALDDLDALFGSIEDAYKTSLGRDDIEVWDEKR